MRLRSDGKRSMTIPRENLEPGIRSPHGPRRLSALATAAELSVLPQDLGALAVACFVLVDVVPQPA